MTKLSTNYLNFAVVLMILINVVLGCKPLPPENNNATPPTAPTAPPPPSNAIPEGNNKKPVAAPSAEKPAASLKWSDYDRVYSTKSNSTDMQKDALWKNFEGQTVNWSGEVVDVSKGMLGGMRINIKMNEETMTYDITLELKKDQGDKAMALTKGKKINFSGKLVSAGGSVLPLSMEEGEIR